MGNLEDLAAGAHLDIHEPEGRAHCTACNADFPLPHLGTPCPCGSHNIRQTHGTELTVKTMELEAA